MKIRSLLGVSVLGVVLLPPVALFGGYTCGWIFHVANLAEGGCQDLPDHPCPAGDCSNSISPFDKDYTGDDVWIATASPPGFARDLNDAHGNCWTSKACGKPAGVRYFKCVNEDCVDHRGDPAFAFEYCSEVTVGAVTSSDPYTSAVFISPVVCGGG